MRIVSLLILQFQIIISCPKGFFNHTSVICNLWDIHTSKAVSQAQISSPTGSWASHLSPPDSRCELFLFNASARGKRFKVHASHAFIDSSSSIKFFTCSSLLLCNPKPALTWSGVSWNPQSFPINMHGYNFEIVTDSDHIKIVLQTSITSSSYATNTFALSWSNHGCMPCMVAKESDGKWDPYIRRVECE